LSASPFPCDERQDLGTGLAPFDSAHPLETFPSSSRAYALASDSTKSRKAYRDFLARWKDADADIPVLIEAKREYAKLAAK
jgi:hypothetical protein